MSYLKLSPFLIFFPLLLAAQAPDLPTVLSRAARYVEIYEDKQLGNLLVAEDYAQTWTIGSFLAGQRRTQSDFLILAFGDERVGLRIVNKVDGAAVKSKKSSFDALMEDSPEGMRRRMQAIQEESSSYNIGNVLRQINVPTFPLKVARGWEAPHFSFVKRGNDKINGVETWEVRFEEQRAPTLVHGLQGESLLSTGALWIEPGTGRIMKTEFSVENPYSKPKAKGRVTVTYSDNKTMGILVPVEMNERYEADQNVVTCVAKYSNFRAFSVVVRSDIGGKP